MYTYVIAISTQLHLFQQTKIHGKASLLECMSVTCVELSVKRCTMVVLVARDWGKSLARASRFTHTQL